MTEPSAKNEAKLPSAEFAPGNIVAGKYRIDQVLGVGGMGVILAGRHLELDQRVAIKALRKDALEDPEIVARFLREARASAKLQSEHVARVIDVGRHGESQVPFIIMEFLRGSDLSEVQKAKGPLPIPLAVEYVLQACEAIAEAHALGIVHRDLKPANLFLTKRPDGSDLVKVLDFGISKMKDNVDIATGSDPLTKTAMMMGSPHYMPPEQLRSARDVDHRADIWSLGIVLHKLLTGEHAFEAHTTPELCVSILVGLPQPLRAALPNAPPALEQVILHCLQKEPTARFANVAELARALEPFASTKARVSIDQIVTMQRNGRSGSIPPGAADAPYATDGTASAETSVDVVVPISGDAIRLSTMAASVASTEAARRNAGLPKSRAPFVVMGLGALLVLGAVGFVAAPRVLPALKKARAANATSNSTATTGALADTKLPPIPPESTPPAAPTPAASAAPDAPADVVPAASGAPASQASARGNPGRPAGKVSTPRVKGPTAPTTTAAPQTATAQATPAAPATTDPSGFGDRK